MDFFVIVQRCDGRTRCDGVQLCRGDPGFTRQGGGDLVRILRFREDGSDMLAADRLDQLHHIGGGRRLRVVGLNDRDHIKPHVARQVIEYSVLRDDAAGFSVCRRAAANSSASASSVRA